MSSWREMADFSRPLTVPASKLIEPITDRMPAILADEDWATWLGEEAASPADAKAVLKTVEGVDWRIAKEEKPPKPRAARPQEDLF